MSEKILFVDDDANVLAAYSRTLRRRFQLATAQGGAEGLELIERQGPFAVVIADMRMPEMDGIQFLARVKATSPDTVRMMLTGNADLQTAIDAVNEGHVFRFLVKPCPPETLIQAIEAGLAQYRLVMAERDLLERTLTGSVKLLTDLLSASNPLAFSQAARLRRYCRHMVMHLGWPNSWQFELAAMLSPIGLITLPDELVERIRSRKPLTAEEKEQYLFHPEIGARLLANIPRLELIAEMIRGQLRPFRGQIDPQDPNDREHTIALGAQMLHVALGFDDFLQRGLSAIEAIAAMRLRPDEYNPRVTMALEGIGSDTTDRPVRLITVAELQPNMVAEQDVRARNGLLLLYKGQEVTLPVLISIRNIAKEIGVTEPFLVRLPTAETAEPAAVG